MIKYYDRPVLFYTLSLLTTWMALFAASPLSHGGYPMASGFLMLIGLASPTVIAFSMMHANPNLKHDLFKRLFKLSGVKPFYIFLSLFLMPISILLAQAISLLFGYPLNQFVLSSHGSFTFSLFPIWFVLILAPLLEELAWHSYGTDCLRAKMNLFWTCLVFGVFWVFWHLPLSFIKGFYHSNIAHISVWHSLNFAISLFPFVFLMNWLYYKSNRNIIIAIVFHIMAGVSNEIFCTHPDVKIIQTALLAVLSGFIMYQKPAMFFNSRV